MLKYITPILIILLLILCFVAKAQGNIPLLISLAFLLMIVTIMGFFFIKFDEGSGLAMYMLALLMDIVSIFKLIQRDFKFNWLAIFALATFYLILLRATGWFGKVKRGAIYIGYYIFLAQLTFSLFLIGINKSFLTQGAILFFIHSLLLLLFLATTKEKK